MSSVGSGFSLDKLMWMVVVVLVHGTQATTTTVKMVLCYTTLSIYNDITYIYYNIVRGSLSDLYSLLIDNSLLEVVYSSILNLLPGLVVISGAVSDHMLLQCGLSGECFAAVRTGQFR